MSILLGAGFTVGLTFVAELIGMLAQSMLLQGILGALALYLAGYLTLRLRPSSRPWEPAAGAAGIVLAVALVGISMGGLQFEGAPPAAEQPTGVQLGISLVLATVLAFALTWLGARLGARFVSRRRPPRQAPPREELPRREPEPHAHATGRPIDQH